MDIDDPKTDFEATQVSAVYDQERLTEDDERAHRSWLYRVWVGFHIPRWDQANVVDNILVPDCPGLGRRLLYSWNVQCNERDRWRRKC